MASAFKCDRCGMVIVGKPTGRIEVVQTDEDYGIKVELDDICYSCFSQVRAFVQDRPKSPT